MDPLPEPLPATDDVPVIDAGVMRRALLRAVVAGSAGSVGALAYGQIAFGGGDRIYLLVIGATGGLVVLPAVLAEVLTERWPRGGKHALLLAALVWFLAALGTWAGYVQAHYTVSILNDYGNQEALRFALDVLKDTLDRPGYNAVMFSGIAVAFAGTALFRRLGLPLWGQIPAALGASLVLAGPLHVGLDVLSSGDGEFSFFMTLLGAVALPPTYWLSDWTERRFWSADPASEDPARAGGASGGADVGS